VPRRSVDPHVADVEPVGDWWARRRSLVQMFAVRPWPTPFASETVEALGAAYWD
jgi:hypothetical protein